MNVTMTHHHVVRQGAHWVCVHCQVRWPYPAPVPSEDGETCPPRVCTDTES